MYSIVCVSVLHVIYDSSCVWKEKFYIAIDHNVSQF